jgi:hypothetical protein
MIDSYLPKDYRDYIYLYATKYILDNKYFFLNLDAFKQYLTTLSRDFIEDFYSVNYEAEKSNVAIYIRVAHNDTIHDINEYIFNPFNIDYGDNKFGNNDIYSIEVYNDYGFDSEFYVVVPNLQDIKEAPLFKCIE